LTDVRKIIFFFVLVIFEDGFSLCECDAGKKGDAHPVMDDAAGNVDVVAVIESMKLFKVKLVAAKLRLDFSAVRAGKLVDVEEVTSQEIGVHARFGFVAVMIEGGESFWPGLVGAGERSKKEKSEQG
jgi:hypothetical protein